MKTRTITLFAVMAILMAGPVFADVTIIANPDVPTDTISQTDLKNIFLGNRVKWSNGDRIYFTLSGNSDTHQSFLKTYVGRTPSQFQMHWRNMVFTGKGQMPTTLDSEQAVIDYVANTKGAVGYVTTPPVSGDVKTLTVN
ncbi:MAG: hypothetical protein SWH68_10035 [Thermodesulfobacteriota bacterium]|nr:hypothetical protein [Thermodesulfobacteriota bacterium]